MQEFHEKVTCMLKKKAENETETYMCKKNSEWVDNKDLSTYNMIVLGLEWKKQQRKVAFEWERNKKEKRVEKWN